MRIPVVINGKKYKLSYFKWLAYENQKKLDRIEKKLNKLLYQCSNQSTDKSTDNGNTGTD